MIKQKILLFLQDGVGGAERISVLLGKSLPKERYDIVFCLVERECKTSIADFIPNGYPIIRIENTNPLKMVWRLISVIWREQPHVVFSSVMYLNTKILSFNFLFPKTRFVIRCENYLYTFNKKQRSFIHLCYHRADAIIAQTQEMKDELVNEMHIKDEKINVIQNPVDTELIDRLVGEGKNPYPQNGKKHIVASGRFTYQKGFDLLIRAFCMIIKERDDIDLFIIGDKDKENGKVFQDVMKIAYENNAEKNVHCLGYQKNPYIYIRHADCFVLSSRWEGLPNVMIEALYLGTPIAAFKCIPVIERIVKNGETGFLAEKEDIYSLSLAMQNAFALGRVNSKYKFNLSVDFEQIIIGTKIK
ncbi:MAG: glycosyltransferase [Bacteroidaceae bacterium]|nr:glycosyltransferase [Bacteroidaceae bacterium]